MSVGRFRPLSRLLVFALAAALGGACSLDTRPTGTTGLRDGGPGSGGNAGTAGGAVGGRGGSSGNGGVGGSDTVGGAPNGGNAGLENCLDKQDNDNNGFTDCADPACSDAGYKCVPTPPAGWEGYFRASGDTFNTTTTAPPCPDGNPPVKYRSDPLPATCSQCTCGPVQGITCGQAHVFCSSSSTDCTGATDWSSLFQSCNQAGSPSQLSCRMQAVTATGTGTCAPSGGQPQSSDMWGRWLYVCGAPGTTGGGCVPGESCAAPGTGPYSGTVCIRKSGEQTCPTGWGTKLTGYQDGTDKRSCSPCTCTPDPSSIKCSTGEYTFYDHNDCTCDWHVICDASKKVNSTACVDVSSLLGAPLGGSDWGGKYTTAPALANGGCTPSGGAPTGSVQTTGAVTYCCR